MSSIDSRVRLDAWLPRYFDQVEDLGEARKLLGELGTLLGHGGSDRWPRYFGDLTLAEAERIEPDAMLHEPAAERSTALQDALKDLLDFVHEGESRRTSSALEIIETFYGEPIETVPAERLALDYSQMIALSGLLFDHYDQPQLLHESESRLDGSLTRPAFPLLTRPPNYTWVTEELPLVRISHSFVLYVDRFAIHDPLAAFVRGINEDNPGKRLDSISSLISPSEASRFVARSLALVRGLAPLIRSGSVSLIDAHVEPGVAPRLHDHPGDMKWPAGADHSHLMQLIIWDQFAERSGLQPIASDKYAYELLSAGYGQLVRSKAEGIEVRRSSLINRLEVPDLSRNTIESAVQLRESVGPLNEFRGAIAQALGEAERYVNSAAEDLAVGVVEESLAACATRLEREVRRSPALESLVSGALVLSGGAVELAATGQVSGWSTAPGALAGLAPWVVARARRRLTEGGRGDELLRDYVVGLVPAA